MTGEQRILSDTEDHLADMVENIDGFIEWALDEGYTAIAHKLEEARAGVNSAAAAASQYANGILSR